MINLKRIATERGGSALDWCLANNELTGDHRIAGKYVLYEIGLYSDPTLSTDLLVALKTFGTAAVLPAATRRKDAVMLAAIDR